jgi:endoglucanase
MQIQLLSSDLAELRIAASAAIFGVLVSASSLHAQEPAATNSAAAAAGPSSSALVPAPSVAAASFLPNGDFQTATTTPNWPDGWTRGPDGLMTWELENGKHFIRLQSQQPGQVVQVSQTAPIPAGTKGIDLVVSFRTANVKFGKSFSDDARATFQLLDAQGNEVKPSPGDGVFDSHAASWTEMSKHFLVPDGATQVRMIFSINKAASGTVDIQDARLTPMSDADVHALVMAPILAAQKQVADDAEVQRMIALPSKTQELKVSGSQLVTAAGTDVWLQGVNIPSLEWSAKGENILRSVKEALEDWKANCIRLPMNDNFWFGRGRPPTTSNDQEAYRQIVDNVVKMVAGQGAYVVLDLHVYHAPTDADVAFWKDAAARYKNNPAVLFDIFNEPTGIGWPIWQKGGTVTMKQKNGPPTSFQSPGMQGLVDAVRSTGARNIIIAGGVGNAYDLEGVLNGYALSDPTGNGIMYATHFYNWHRNWEKHFLNLAGKVPIFVGETGADIKKMPFIPGNQQESPYTWAPNAIGMIQKYHLNWTAYSMHPKSTPVLILNWNYDPSPFWGVFVKEALAGKQFEMTGER